MSQVYRISNELVGATGLEPATSTSRTWRATNCATPRYATLNQFYELIGPLIKVQIDLNNQLKCILIEITKCNDFLTTFEAYCKIT